MNFEDERYIRSYVRDTLTRKMLKWQGRLVFHELQRKCDRAGVLDVDFTHKPDLLIEALSELLDIPPDIVKVGLARAVELGCVELHPKFLFLPRFMAAQEARQSDKQRQRESRARRHDLATRGFELSQNVTGVSGSFCDNMSQNVTPDLAGSFRDNRSQNVTEGQIGSQRDALSQIVTIPPHSGQNVTPYYAKLLNSSERLPATGDGARLAIRVLCDSSVDHISTARIAAGSGRTAESAGGRVIELMRRMLQSHPCTVAELQRMGEIVATGGYWGFTDVLTISTLCARPDLVKGDKFDELLTLARTPIRVAQQLPPDDPRRNRSKKRAERPSKARSGAKPGKPAGKPPRAAPAPKRARKAPLDPAADAARKQLPLLGHLT